MSSAKGRKSLDVSGCKSSKVNVGLIYFVVSEQFDDLVIVAYGMIVSKTSDVVGSVAVRTDVVGISAFF